MLTKPRQYLLEKDKQVDGLLGPVSFVAFAVGLLVGLFAGLAMAILGSQILAFVLVFGPALLFGLMCVSIAGWFVALVSGVAYVLGVSLCSAIVFLTLSIGWMTISVIAVGIMVAWFLSARREKPDLLVRRL